MAGGIIAQSMFSFSIKLESSFKSLRTFSGVITNVCPCNKVGNISIIEASNM